MSGNIRVESEVGKGSVFYFTAVFQRGNPQAVAEQQEKEDLTTSQGKPLRILLAEDNPMNAKLVMIFLLKRHHHVVHVGNGQEVLQQLGREPFDLILMDLEMPEMDGFEATKCIRNDTSGTFAPNIPIIALTAHSLPEYREQIFQCGMNNFITKPLDLYKLARVLNGLTPYPDTLNNEQEPAFINAFQKCAKKTNVCFNPDGVMDSEDPSLMGWGAPPFEKIIDREAALKRLAGDRDLYDKFCRMFLEEIPEILGQLQASFAGKNVDDLKKRAHYLKGSAAMIGAECVTHYAALLEKASFQHKNLEETGHLLAHVERELSQVQRVLADPGQQGNRPLMEDNGNKRFRKEDVVR
jgi:CheY-like chemotaxis protein